MTNLRTEVIKISSDSITLDSVTVIPNTFEVRSELEADESHFSFNYESNTILWQKQWPQDSVLISYRVYPKVYNSTFSRKDTSLMRDVVDNSDFDPSYAYEVIAEQEGYNSLSRINKSGYLSRGLSVGNAQDLSVNSDLNLQLTGYLTDDLQLLASISDANIPIQPGGNTQTLQDFDQVYINVFNDNFSLTGGDYQLKSRPSRYLNYFKRAQGANVTFGLTTPKDSVKHDVMVSAAASKGKYARNIFTAVEGNQGPYRLTGEEGEAFIVILAGTERVFIDGKLLKRGEEFDYTIDYNSSELTFTPNQPITKDKRIQVEFQYSDKNYARSILQVSDHITGEKFKAYISAYSEQDAKNQSLQQILTPENKALLAAVGDDLNAAAISSIDSTGYSPDAVLYALTDSLGYDTVFVYSTDESLGVYTVNFSQVGTGNGDYIQNGFSANGRIYEWVAPDTINGVLVRNGNFAPFVLLVSPKKQQVVAGGLTYQLSKSISLRGEGAFSNQDVNTFSNLDAGDDTGFSSLFGVTAVKDSAVFKSWAVQLDAEAELISEHFSTTERFRSVEFFRDWNLNPDLLTEQQTSSAVSLGIANKKNGSILAENQTFQLGDSYSGNRLGLATNLSLKRIKWLGTASLLNTKGQFNSDFYRHKNDVSYAFKPFKIGYADELEQNRRTDILSTGYAFFDYQFYVANPDSSRNKSKVFYRQRTDEVWLDGRFQKAAIATQVGLSYDWLSGKNQSAKINVSQRDLTIQNESLISQAPENTLLGRVEYRLKAFKNAFNTDLFYQIGSGLEQKREYVYLEVPAGQGTYVWNDYNSDNVRDLEEFEIAAFGYEANFIRTFIPSNDYEKVFSNGFNLNNRLDFGRVWKSKKGWKKALSRFGNQFSVSADRKTVDESSSDRFNPFLTNVNENDLLALNSSLRNTIFYNKLSTTFGADFTIQENSIKTLLTNGLESRNNSLSRLNLRWNYSENTIVKLGFSQENSSSEATYASNRNYNVLTNAASADIIWQPSNKTKFGFNGKFSDKVNELEGFEETADLLSIGTELRVNSPGKGSIELKANVIGVDYSGEANSATAFEMLEGLNSGTNVTWSALAQQNISKNIQLTISYFGRKSEDNPFIHSGSMQVRALF